MEVTKWLKASSLNLIRILFNPRNFPMGDHPDSPLSCQLLSLCHGRHLPREAAMTEVYFHCSTDDHVLIDERGAAMDLAEAREHAEGLVRRPVMTPSVEDWRSWILHVTDELGDELFYVPFVSVLGKLH